MREIFNGIGEFDFVYSGNLFLQIQPWSKTGAINHDWVCSYDCSFLLVHTMFWHFALLFMQIWTKMGTSVMRSSTSCWKTPAIQCLASRFGTSSRTLTATVTIRSPSKSFCRYVNLSTESQLVPSVQNFTCARPGFILSPASKDLALLNEQMCVFALTCVHPGKVEKHARWKNVEARSLKWFCVPVLGFSCVLEAFIPSFCYRSESLSPSLLHGHHISPSNSSHI